MKYIHGTLIFVIKSVYTLYVNIMLMTTSLSQINAYKGKAVVQADTFPMYMLRTNLRSRLCTTSPQIVNVCTHALLPCPCTASLPTHYSLCAHVRWLNKDALWADWEVDVKNFTSTKKVGDNIYRNAQLSIKVSYVAWFSILLYNPVCVHKCTFICFSL